MSVDWVISRISATQLKQYKMCPRKWFYRYVMKKKSPPTPAMQLGTDIHADFEAFLRQEISEPTMTESRYVWQKGLIPPVEKVYAVEIDLSMEGITLCDGAIKLMGYLDLVWFEAGEGKVYVWDWKTRSRFDYAPTADALQEDIQAILYAYGMFVHLSNKGIHVEQIIFAHMNILREDKGGPDHKYVETVMTRKHVEDWIHTHIEPQIYEMNATAKLNLQWVRTHKTECFTYGRCEHYTPCYEIPYLAGVQAPASAEPTFNIVDILTSQKEGEMTNNVTDLMHGGQLATNNQQQQPQQQTQAQPAPQFDVASLFPNHGQPQPQMQQPLPPAQPTVVDGVLMGPPPQQQMPVNPAPQMPMPGQQQQFTQQPQPSVPAPTPQAMPPAHQQAPAPAVAAPNIQPPDTQADIQPRSVATMTVQEFSWADTDGVGPKGVEKILAYCAENGITHMSQLMEGFDLKKLPTVGEKTAQALRVRFNQGVPFTPEGEQPVQQQQQPEGEQPVQQQQTAPDGQPLAPNELYQGADGQPVTSQPTPQQWLEKAKHQFDKTGIIPPYVAQLTPDLKSQFDAYVAHKRSETFRANNPDYAQNQQSESDVVGLAAREAQTETPLEQVEMSIAGQPIQQPSDGNIEYTPLFGVRRVKIARQVGEYALELELELDPDEDAVPAIEDAMAYLGG